MGSHPCPPLLRGTCSRSTQTSMYQQRGALSPMVGHPTHTTGQSMMQEALPLAMAIESTIMVTLSRVLFYLHEFTFNFILACVFECRLNN